jgi:magnesium-protoporphyrin IX monomethyl ester (oxidative) cyclase
MAQKKTKRRIKRCLLFIPPAFTGKDTIDINPMPPIGLGYIAAVLERMGITVRIVDCLADGWETRVPAGSGLIRIGIPDEEIRRIITDFKPDLVGVNNQFSRQYKNARDIYSITKGVDRGITTLAGGAHPAAMPEYELKNNNLDFVLIGESENTIERLVNGIGNINKIRRIDGLGYKHKGKITVNPKTTFIEDLDSIAFPARHLMNMEKYFGSKASHGERRYRRFSPIVTSRGCPAKCTFCSVSRVWGRKYRFRSAENVLEEMRELKYKYDIEELMIEDDNFTAHPARAEKICDMMIKEKLNFKWDTPNGVGAWTLTPGLIKKMKEAGCYKLNIAVESGNQRVLKEVIKKPLELKKAEEVIRTCKKIGLECGIFFILGMPGSTLEEMWDNYRFAKKVRVFHPFFSVATPYPGSELYDICRNNGYIPKDFRLDDLYIRSFIIKTGDWNGAQIRSLMLRGWVYLKFFQAIYEPVPFIKWFSKWIKRKCLGG